MACGFRLKIYEMIGPNYCMSFWIKPIKSFGQYNKICRQILVKLIKYKKNICAYMKGCSH